MSTTTQVLITILLAVLSVTTNPHPGRAATDGCHVCRTNCTHWGVTYNQRHCHNTGSEPQERSTGIHTYSRNDWKHWIDTDGDCQNSRHELLIELSQLPPSFTNEENCVVLNGKWIDPYTNKSWLNASNLDVDHIVPLKWAHDHGGKMWPKSIKILFANDPDNLLLVEDKINRQKSSSGPLNWLPPLKSYHCIYLNSWLLIIEKYKLTPSKEETAFIKSNLEHCNIPLNTN